ncbi:hypothetical protein CJJ07_003563 [Candidozyma auris]|nr:hypothetical protein CJJ07_003563 [[Candida] auris]QEL61245.1 hypothetical protein CJJ09_003383 [[Candida] auris]
MSTTTSTRTTPSFGPGRGSPRIRPSPISHLPREFYSQGSRLHSRRGSLSSSPDGNRNPRKQKLASPPNISRDIDPFLAKYLKPSVNDKHESYFKSLEKHFNVRGYDFYSQYFNKATVPTSPSQTQTLRSYIKERRRVVSPLSRQIPTDTFDNESSSDDDDDTSEDRIRGQRRRKSTGESVSPGPTSKKLHSQVYTTRLPSDFMKCSIDDLIDLIHRMLQSLINLNDKGVPPVVSNPGSVESGELPAEEKKKLLTRFHSRTPPAISIKTYLARLTRFNNFTQATLLTTIYYIDLLSHNYQPYFTLNSWTVHRFLLVATMLAQKSLEDFFYTNDHYAKVGGVALTELNCLELDFLTRVNWKLVPAKQMDDHTTSIRYSKQVLDLYYEQLISLMGASVSEHNNVVYKLAGAEHI